MGMTFGWMGGILLGDCGDVCERYVVFIVGPGWTPEKW